MQTQNDSRDRVVRWSCTSWCMSSHKTSSTHINTSIRRHRSNPSLPWWLKGLRTTSCSNKWFKSWMKLESPEPLTKSRAAEKVWMQLQCSSKAKSQMEKVVPTQAHPLPGALTEEWRSQHYCHLARLQALVNDDHGHRCRLLTLAQCTWTRKVKERAT